MLIKRNHDEGEEHNTGTDRYLITYADLITLLLGLFVILYASSQIDEERFKDVSAALAEYFKSDNPNHTLKGGDGALQGGKHALPDPVLSNLPQPPKNLNQISEETKKVLSDYIQQGKIILKQDGKELNLKLPEDLLFRSGSAEIQPGGMTIIDTLATVLRGITYQIEIDGHTDSDPIRTFKFESNWHLSGARAVNVAYRLIRKGVPESNMSFRGFSSQRPVTDNSTPENKALNRRVEITITELPPEAPSNNGYSE